MNDISYFFRVVWACAKKDVRIALTERVFTIASIFVPLNFLILLVLFVLSGSNAPTAVVMEDNGPYAQALYDAMANAHSFRLQQASASEAQNLLNAGKIVAVVTIPANFDQSVQANTPVQVRVDINNLNTDFTNDIRRAVPLAITTFYAKAFPNLVTITPHEVAAYRQDTDYVPYLAVSVLVIGLMVGGLLQSGTAAAREWERETAKELLLSPASRGAIVLGKMLGALLLSLVPMVVVLVVLVLGLRVFPAHWDQVLGFSLLTLVLFIALGTLLGTLLKQRQSVTALSLGIALPLFFVSGPFGPLSFGTQATQVIASIFPVSYAIVLQQQAFHNFQLNTFGAGINTLILLGYALAFLGLAAIALRRSAVTH